MLSYSSCVNYISYTAYSFFLSSRFPFQPIQMQETRSNVTTAWCSRHPIRRQEIRSKRNQVFCDVTSANQIQETRSWFYNRSNISSQSDCQKLGQAQKVDSLLKVNCIIQQDKNLGIEKRITMNIHQRNHAHILHRNKIGIQLQNQS